MSRVTNTTRALRWDECTCCDPEESAVRALRGTNILIVEDEALLALDLALTVREEGAAVEGPVHRLDAALALADLESVDAAILDVDIAGEEVFAFADRLRELRVPIVFHTGRADLSRLMARYPEARILRKPSTTMQIVRTLSQVIARALASPAHAAAS